MAITKATASSIAPAAKGDLVVGSGTNDAAVLAVGSANQVLTVDSSTATGLKWASASTPAFDGAHLKKSTGQTVTANTNTAVTFDQEEYDTSNYHNNSTNNTRITVPQTGYYRFTINTRQSQYSAMDGSTNFAKQQVNLYKNGSSYSGTLSDTSFTEDIYATANDYFEFYYYSEGTQSLTSRFIVQYLGA